MGIIETTLNNVAEAAVGSPENNLALSQNSHYLTFEHNLFMKLTQNRFAKELATGKVENYLKHKNVVLSGYVKIMQLLSRANRK
jgi:hypothetical protein